MGYWQEWYDSRTTIRGKQKGRKMKEKTPKIPRKQRKKKGLTKGL